jgi:hypothetical protein
MQVTIELNGKVIAEETIRISSDVSLQAEIDAAIQRVADKLWLDSSKLQLRIGNELHSKRG